MSQPVQVFATNDPNNCWSCIDNGASQVVITVTSNGGVPVYSTETGIGADKSTLGMDNTLNGAIDQAVNFFADTGSTTLDPVNDVAAFPDPSNATVNGNPVSLTQFTYSKLIKVLTNPLSATILFKSPA